MAYILSEVPSGAINGTNAAFTTSRTGSTVVSVFKDGAEVSPAGFTYSGTTLTFVTAPLYSVSIVYVVGAGFALNSWEVLIPNEIASGAINGTNKTFTVSGGPIKRVLSIVYDGAETRDYSYVPGSNVITLVNAPTVPTSPVYVDYVSYSGSGSDSAFAGNSTLAELVDRLYSDILHERTDSTVYRLPTAKALFSELRDAVCTGGYETLDGRSIIGGKNLTFLKRNRNFTTYKPSKLTADLAAGRSTMKAKSNTFPTSGSVVINGRVIDYSGNDGETLTLVNPSTVSASNGTHVRLVYAIPNDVYRSVDVKYWMEDGRGIPMLETDWRDRIETSSASPRFFYVENDYGLRFIGFNVASVGNSNVSFSYRRIAPDITDTVNSVIPSPYAINILPYLVAARFYANAGEINAARSAESLGTKEMKRLYLNFATKSDTFKDRIASNNTNFIPFI